MKNFLFLLLVLMALQALSQAPIVAYQLDLDKADVAYKSKKYNTAAGFYKKAFGKIKDEELKQKTLFNIAESYRRSNNYKQAIKWYEDAINAKYPDPNILYSYGQLLKNFERYDEAARQFYDFLFEVPKDTKGMQAQQSCLVAQSWKANPQKFTIKNIKELNTEFSDYSPFYSNDKIVWSSSRKEAQGKEIFEWTGQKCSDFFEATITAETYSKPSNVKGAVNTPYNDGVAWLDSTATTMYYTQCNGIDGKGINCKIYVSYYQNNTWIAPTLLPFNSDSFSCGHPALTADGKRMYFSSDMPYGFGEKDIYYSNYDEIKNKWTAPVNLGANVNTNEDDMFPFVSEDGNIYYSTKGNVGMGGLDIFMTKDSLHTFKKATNLQYPINSGADDFGINFLPKNKHQKGKPIAYISSNREGGLGDDDIYSVAIKPFVFLAKIKTIDREQNQATTALVMLNDSIGKNIFAIKTNDKGELTAELPLGILMNVFAKKDNYFSSAVTFISSKEIVQDSIIEITLYLDAIPAPEIDFTLQGIFYDIDKFDLRAESKKVLDSLSIILKNNPNIVIELASHTDSRAPADYNIILSKNRAQSCVNYLVKTGIAKDRLVPVGYGETKLINDCSDDVNCTEEEHQQNRRTTIRVLKTYYKGR